MTLTSKYGIKDYNGNTSKCIGVTTSWVILGGRKHKVLFYVVSDDQQRRRCILGMPFVHSARLTLLHDEGGREEALKLSMVFESTRIVVSATMDFCGLQTASEVIIGDDHDERKN